MTHLCLGCHLSPSKGMLSMAKTAFDLKADTFQFFARNPRGSKAKSLNSDDIQEFNKFLSSNHFGPVLVHAPYTLNPSSNKSETREFAFLVMKDDLKRVTEMNLGLYNLHPGSHIGQGKSNAIKNTADLLNNIIPHDFKGYILLETMSGQGSEIGSTFEELSEIISCINLQEKIGVCFDTCHVFEAGYDIVSDLDGVITRFDRILGLDRLKYIHLNDSVFGLGMHKDRHAAIGKGKIGIQGISNIINHPALKILPFCLETPHDSINEYAVEIELVRSLINDR